MTSPTTTPCTPCLPVVGAGYSRMAKNLPRRRCDIVTFGSRSTAYGNVAPGSKPLPLVAKKTEGRQAPQWKSARFALNIVDDDWMQKEKAASQSGND